MAGPDVADSILNSIKKLLGYEPEYDVNDVDLIIHINSEFANFHILGIGSTTTAFSIEDENDTWQDFMGTDPNIKSVKNLIFHRVRLIFDPPETSFAQEALKQTADKLEWLLVIQGEEKRNGTPIGS